jgi:AAA15 family ATPase/GTPase
MAILKDLKITNFRCFDSIKIDRLSKLNIFVGQNNSGKTSALEAVFLLMGLDNPYMPGNLNSLRGFTKPVAEIKTLYHNLSYENKPIFNGVFSDNMVRQLTIETIFNDEDISGNISTQYVPKASDIELICTKIRNNQTEETLRSKLNIKSGKHEGIIARFITTPAVFISPLRAGESLLYDITELKKRKEDETLLHLLQDTFDKNIVDIIPMPDGIYFNLANLNELVPIQIMGDGLRRFLSIMTDVLSRDSRFILIDEIENGLHYTAYKSLWKALLSFAHNNKVQFFISTHSIETLECLTSLLDEDTYEGMRDYTKVIALTKTKEAKFKAYNYSYEEFKTAINNHSDLRR